MQNVFSAFVFLFCLLFSSYQINSLMNVENISISLNNYPWTYIQPNKLREWYNNNNIDEKSLNLNGFDNFNKFSFLVMNNSFVLDGEIFQIIGCEMQYFRIASGLWIDRLYRLRAMGCNTIQTYIPWSLHQPKEEEVFIFNNNLDFVKFVQLVDELGMWVLLRIGPYVSSELDFGGLPAWMLRYPDLQTRTYNERFLNFTSKWYNELLPIISNLLWCNNGMGPVLAIQIENEYAFQGNVLKNPNDKNYLIYLHDITRQYLGDDILLYTCDDYHYLLYGSIPGSFLITADFADTDNTAKAFAAIQHANPEGSRVLFNSELHPLHTVFWSDTIIPFRSAYLTKHNKFWCFFPLAQLIANTISEYFNDYNASFSIYPAVGGTNFGFIGEGNCATFYKNYTSIITSYDHFGPITEWGMHHYDSDGDRYDLIRTVLQQHFNIEFPQEPPTPTFIAYNDLKPVEIASLFGNAKQIATSIVLLDTPISQEMMQQTYGYTMYTTIINYLQNNTLYDSFQLKPDLVRDRLTIYINEQQYGIPIWRNDNSYIREIQLNKTNDANFDSGFYTVEMESTECLLTLLLDNMGHCYTMAQLHDRKGIGNVTITWPNNPEIQTLHNWTAITLPFDYTDLSQLSWLPFPSVHLLKNVDNSDLIQYLSSPVFLRYYLDISDSSSIADTFIYFPLSGFSKGIIYVNGYNLGRYWPSVGPQQTLYLPSSFLIVGKNEIILFEEQSIPKHGILSFTQEQIIANHSTYFSQ